MGAILYRCPTCGDLLEVVHDLDALRPLAASWMKLFEERYKRTTGPTARASGARRVGRRRPCATITSSRWTKAARTSSGPSATAASSASNDLWVKQCGNSHTGSFKDLGMTVLVSTVEQMIADGKPLRAVACASTGDTSAALAAYGAAAGIRSMVLLPRGKVSTGAVGAAARQRRDRARPSTPTSTAAWRLCSVSPPRRGLPRQLDEHPAPRRPEDGGDRDRAAVRLGGARCIVIPGGNLGNVSALGAGFDMMQALGLIASGRASSSRRPSRQPALSRVQGRLGHFEPITAQPTLASAIQIGNPVSVQKAIRTLQRIRRRRRAGHRGRARRTRGARRSHRPVQLPAHGRRAGRAREAARAEMRMERSRGGDLDRERPQVHRLQGALSRGDPARRPQTQATPTTPCTYPNDYLAVRDEVRRRHD